MSMTRLVPAALSILLASMTGIAHAAFQASDPGVRQGDPGAGAPLAGLSDRQSALFNAGKLAFEATEGLTDGLGPRFNLDSCGGCHAQPATGGTSAAHNPQADIPAKFPNNILPSFITADGPVREARFKRLLNGMPDGGVHDLFVIDCGIAQENFAAQLEAHNVIFRIPTPVFGGGLIEQIPDSAIVANSQADLPVKMAFGIAGKVNLITVSGDFNKSGNDGTISRFGWKAQNKSLLLFAGEAYNVEMGITNELFPTEREEATACQYKPVPNDTTNPETTDLLTGLSDVEKFAAFMRFLAPPTPSANRPGGVASIAQGKSLFGIVGCALCHTPAFQTGNTTIEALRYKAVNLFSDLLLHNMGPNLADDISQGQAGADEFRTAPLWGLGQRIFLLHDGRTTDLLEAIQAHQSAGSFTYPPSEANAVISKFNSLSEEQKQDLLNFLRSL